MNQSHPPSHKRQRLANSLHSSQRSISKIQFRRHPVTPTFHPSFFSALRLVLRPVCHAARAPQILEARFVSTFPLTRNDRDASHTTEHLSWLVNRNQCEVRSLRINASRRGRSSSLTAVNFSANPWPGSTRRTIVSALICPSWTRNSSLAVEPTPLDLWVSRNRPPRLILRTRETSSRPAQRQSTHTPSCVSTREVNLLEWKTDCCNMWHHRLRAFQR